MRNGGLQIDDLDSVAHVCLGLTAWSAIFYTVIVRRLVLGKELGLLSSQWLVCNLAQGGICITFLINHNLSDYEEWPTVGKYIHSCFSQALSYCFVTTSFTLYWVATSSNCCCKKLSFKSAILKILIPIYCICSLPPLILFISGNFNQSTYQFFNVLYAFASGLGGMLPAYSFFLWKFSDFVQNKNRIFKYSSTTHGPTDDLRVELKFIRFIYILIWIGFVSAGISAQKGWVKSLKIPYGTFVVWPLTYVFFNFDAHIKNFETLWIGEDNDDEIKSTTSSRLATVSVTGGVASDAQVELGVKNDNNNNDNNGQGADISNLAKHIEDMDGVEAQNAIYAADATVAAHRQIRTSVAAMSTKATFVERLKIMFIPVKVLGTVKVGHGDEATNVLIRPEAFRMLFYVGFMFYLLIGILVTTFLSDRFDETDNPILDTFGTNNICIYFDERPFTYVSSFLFMPLLLLLLCFEGADAIRVHDCYMDDGILTKPFIIFYSIVTAYEFFAVLFFVQVFAVTPRENIFIHTIPYLMLIYAFWTLGLKRFLYFRMVHKAEKWQEIGGHIYIIFMFLSASIKAFIILPNLYGAEMWKQDGLEWTQTLGAINERLFTFLTVFCPLFVYYKIGWQLRALTFTVNRTKITYQDK